MPGVREPPQAIRSLQARNPLPLLYHSRPGKFGTPQGKRMYPQIRVAWPAAVRSRWPWRPVKGSAPHGHQPKTAADHATLTYMRSPRVGRSAAALTLASNEQGRDPAEHRAGHRCSALIHDIGQPGARLDASGGPDGSGPLVSSYRSATYKRWRGPVALRLGCLSSQNACKIMYDR